MSEQNRRPPNRGLFNYGAGAMDLSDLATDAIAAILQTKFEEKNRPVPPPNELRSMAEFLHKRSLNKGHPKHLT